jgi:hypothetical protein
MSTSQLEDLKTAHANLLAQYDKHLEDVRALQRAVLEDVLPDVLEETVPRADMPLHEEVGLFAREWLQDEGVWNREICSEETTAQECGQRVLGQVLEWFSKASSGVHYELISDVLVRRPENEGDNALISGCCGTGFDCT